MQQQRWRSRVPLFLIPALLIASCGLLGMLSWSETAEQRRLGAQGRWSARPFASYRIAIRVEYGGNTCMQELETHGEQLGRIVANSCRVSWIGLSTVARLFEISELLDRPTPCYTLVQPCSCYRVLQRAIEYEPQLGYPLAIVYRRVAQPNVTSPVYWRRLVDTRRLPVCGPPNYDVTISVLSVKPLL